MATKRPSRTSPEARALRAQLSAPFGASVDTLLNLASQRAGRVLRTVPEARAALQRMVRLPELPPRPAGRGADSFGERVRWARLTRHWRQEDLGAAVGETKVGINGKERRGLASLAAVERLAEALGVSAAWLAFGVGPPFQLSSTRTANRQVSKRSANRTSGRKTRRSVHHGA